MSKRRPVIIAPSAERDVLAIRDYIARDKPGAAQKWSRTISRRMKSLKTMPFGHEMIPEAADLGVAYRHIIVGNYRVIYDVLPDRVWILRVVHAARQVTARLFEEISPEA